MQSIDTKFNIRDATVDDIKAIKAIDDELGGLHPNLEDKVKDMVADEHSTFLVAEFDGKIVGYAGGVVRDTEFGESDPVAYVTHVGLNSEFKSKGMGKMLGDRLVTALEKQAPTIRTILSFDRGDLQSFFNAIGFKKTDLMVFEYDE